MLVNRIKIRKVVPESVGDVTRIETGEPHVREMFGRPCVSSIVGLSLGPLCVRADLAACPNELSLFEPVIQPKPQGSRDAAKLAESVITQSFSAWSLIVTKWPPSAMASFSDCVHVAWVRR